jgi:hypothetical protein
MIAIDKLTPAQLERLLHMDSIIVEQQRKAEKVLALRAYYDGDHPVMLTERQQEFIGPLLDSKAPFSFAHNHVRSIIDTLRERLAVTGVNLEGVGEGDTTSPKAIVQAAMWQWWTRARMDSDQIRLYRRALRDGLCYLMVDFDPETMRPRFTMHHVDAGDKEPGIVLHRDPSDQNKVLYATRHFVEFNPLEPGVTGTRRKTVYMPDQIRKYVMGGSGWEAVKDSSEEPWPIPWVDRNGKPLGVPVIEFANPGGSEVEQIIGLQNALNKAWLDLIAAADTSGFPLVVFNYLEDTGQLSGAQDDADHEGSDELRLSPARVIEVIQTDVKRLEAADMSQMIAVIDRIELAISGVSRTPSYYLRPVGGSDVPSGEALKQLESGLVRRAEERQLVFGQAWEDVFALAYRVNQVFGPRLPDVPDMSLTVTWQDANVRNELAEAQTAEAHQRLGVPQVELWRRMGYTPEQIERFQQEQAQQEQAKVAMVTAAMRTQQSMQNGNGAPQANGTNGVQVQPAQRNGTGVR